MNDAAPKAEKETSGALSTPELAAEGGFPGWLCVGGAFLCLFCSFGFLSAYAESQNMT